ncbi:MAG: ATP-dependent helicase [Candidatus Desantisbacteria bacterium]
MSDKINLSPNQEKIVYYNNGAILVKAGAGSGKTRVLTERIKFLINKTKRKILAITFTNKAGEEIKDRLSDISELKNRLFVGTFHGFCEQVLQNHGKSIGFAIMPHIFEDEADRLKLIEQAIELTPSYYADYKQLNAKSQKEFRYKALNFISEAKRELLSEEKIYEETKNNDIVLLYKTYQDILLSQNAIDFDDLFLLTYKLFTEQTSIAALYRRTYEYICIDEAQDLNNAQYQLLRALTNGEHNNVMMVGDPNQSIFAFNGSSSDFMSKYFVEDFKPTIYELKENYRSSQSVLRIAEKIIPDSNDLINTVKEGIFEIHSIKNEEEEANWIYGKIKELIELKNHKDIEGDITYEKIAVLARNKYVFNHIEKLFKEKNIPFYYKITPGAIQFESNTMKIFDMALRVKLNSQDTFHWQRLCELLQLPHTKIIDLNQLQQVSEINDIDKKIIEIAIDLDNEGSNLKTLFEKYKKDVINDNDNERKMILDDIEELLIHWFNYAKKTENKSLHYFKNAMALGQTHPLSQSEGITLSTVHTMKGQEYDIVFLMGMDDETFPDYRAIRSRGVELTQEKNNLYVAITRAKRFLYVTWPKQRLMPWGDYKDRKISRFLEDINGKVTP